MSLKKSLFIIISCLTINYRLWAQTPDEVSEMSNIFDKKNENTHIRQKIEKSTSGMFVFYKKFISSQDAVSCVFHPSCSVYAVESIDKHGFFIGMLSALDRLSRCHNLSIEYYHYNKKLKLLDDPVE